METQAREHNIQRYHSPLWGGVRTVEWILELNNISVFLFQLPMMLHVILHQLCQSGKLLPAVKVVVVSCVLDLNVGDGSISPAEKAQSFRETSPSGAQTDSNRKPLKKVSSHISSQCGIINKSD